MLRRVVPHLPRRHVDTHHGAGEGVAVLQRQVHDGGGPGGLEGDAAQDPKNDKKTALILSKKALERSSQLKQNRKQPSDRSWTLAGKKQSRQINKKQTPLDRIWTSGGKNKNNKYPATHRHTCT